MAVSATGLAPRVGARWISLLSLANLGLWMGYFGPLQVLLPNQIGRASCRERVSTIV